MATVRRKQTPEPVFGSIKSAMGFRQFLLRGLPNVQGEWNLVMMRWNIKRMSPCSPSDGTGRRLNLSRSVDIPRNQPALLPSALLIKRLSPTGC